MSACSRRGAERRRKSEIRSYREYRKAVRRLASPDVRDLYDRATLTRHVGSREAVDLYFESGGTLTTAEYTGLLDLAGIRECTRVLDLGTGRGEIVFQCARRGAVSTGVDYSPDSINLANATRDGLAPELREKASFVETCVTALPFPDSSFDVVFAVELVEHLSRAELDSTLDEIRRVIDPGGTLVVQTQPNRWANTWGYYLTLPYRVARGRRIPARPLMMQYQVFRDDPEVGEDRILCHLNEQSLPGLKRALARAGFTGRLWFEETGDPWLGKRGTAAEVASAIFRLLRVRYLLGRGITAVVTPAGRACAGR